MGFLNAPVVQTSFCTTIVVRFLRMSKGMNESCQRSVHWKNQLLRKPVVHQLSSKRGGIPSVEFGLNGVMERPCCSSRNVVWHEHRGAAALSPETENMFLCDGVSTWHLYREFCGVRTTLFLHAQQKDLDSRKVKFALALLCCQGSAADCLCIHILCGCHLTVTFSFGTPWRTTGDNLT